MSDEFDFSTGLPSEEMAQYLQMFVDETSEQLDALVEVLLVLETKPGSSGHLNESFRLIHSIKGAAAMMGLDGITLLTHHLENHFERLRSGLWALDRPMMNLVLKCVDYLREATEKLREGKPLVSAPELIEQLSAAQPALASGQPNAIPDDARPPDGATESPAAAVPPEPVTLPPEHAASTTTRKRLIAYLDSDIELPELKAELIVARLRELGSIVATSPAHHQMQSIAELRTLQVWLDTPSSDDALRAVADIVGVELIEIDPVEADEEPPAAVQIGHATAGVAETAPSPATHSPRDDADPQDAAVGETVSDAAERNERTPKVSETMRVDLKRLDRLMNLSGELIVQRARFVQLASQMKETFQKSGLQSRIRELCESLREQIAALSPEADTSAIGSTRTELQKELQGCIDSLEDQLSVLEQGRRSYHQLHEAIDQFSRVSDGLQRGVLDTRMVPIGPLFSRFKRTIRDISTELGKKVNFVVRGENTELDKRMIDELADPLVHLVRNAIDHGLESEAERVRRGKPAIGTLKLEAEHRGNNVLITISDDGGGIHCEKVKRRAIERGLATQAEIELMSDFEIQQFIWAPGFSTAEVVSDISGRGVGMDIVRTRIRDLSGTIEVHSAAGVGTQFILRLPLTLAIIRSLLFELEQGTFAAPIEHVREIVSVQKRDIITVNQRNAIDVRGEFIPLVGINDIFDWRGAPVDKPTQDELPTQSGAGSLSVLIMTSGSKSMGLVVADLIGCQDIVVKSLDENFTTIRGLAGASILGDGSVCLLLDVASCIELARQRLREGNLRSN